MCAPPRLQCLCMHHIVLYMCRCLYRHTGSLESFHNTVLAYAPKRSPFQYVVIHVSFRHNHYTLLFRNQSYHSRIQLAVLDHNAHLDRDKAKNKNGEVIYNRKFRKQTKKWDATPSLEKKKYSYIPDLMNRIEKQHVLSTRNLKKAQPCPYDQPNQIAKTIANSQPESTKEIVQKKQSRFC